MSRCPRLPDYKASLVGGCTPPERTGACLRTETDSSFPPTTADPACCLRRKQHPAGRSHNQQRTSIAGKSMTDHRQKKLMELGVETLSEALLSLAIQSPEAEALVNRLIIGQTNDPQPFKKKLASLKRSKRFVDWRGARKLSGELRILLQDLKSSVSDPLIGLEMLADFYKADATIFEKCDDSSGLIGDIFRFEARDLFLDYAARCSQASKIADIILKVNQMDPYGVRDTLIAVAGRCLPEESIRSMIKTLQAEIAGTTGDFEKRRKLYAIESLARQINDAKLFEATRIEAWGSVSTSSIIDIAQVYFNSGDIGSAHAWLKKIPKGETFQAHERDALLKEIYIRQGDNEKLTELVLANFRSGFSPARLQEALDIIGEEKRDEMITDAVERILKSEGIRLSNAQFLIEVGKVDEAEHYLLDNQNQIDGDLYNTVLSLAKAMEAKNRPLSASLLYRSLLTSILQRANTKAYSHGIRYLKKLDKLSQDISDWKGISPHESFKQLIKNSHDRKRSFWSKYVEKS